MSPDLLGSTSYDTRTQTGSSDENNSRVETREQALGRLVPVPVSLARPLPQKGKPAARRRQEVRGLHIERCIPDPLRGARPYSMLVIGSVVQVRQSAASFFSLTSGPAAYLHSTRYKVQSTAAAEHATLAVVRSAELRHWQLPLHASHTRAYLI